MARDHTPPPDRVEECLRMIRSGEPEQVADGWRGLDERYRPDLLRQALRRLDGNQVYAAEVAQDTLTRVWHALPSFRGNTEGEFTTFVLRAGYRRACDIGNQIKQERTHRTAADYVDSITQLQARYSVANQPMPEHLTTPDLAREVVDRLTADQLDPPLEHALKELTPNERQCVDFARRGYTREETAGALHSSPNAVYAHLSNARTKLMPYYLARRLIKRRNRGEAPPS